MDLEFEEFSTFGDLAELEHVCELLRENSTASDHLTGAGSLLVSRLNAQACKTKEILEAERPGLYPRTWMHQLFIDVSVQLEAMTRGTGDVPRLCLALHQVLIAAHEVFHPSRLSRLLANAAVTAVVDKARVWAAESHKDHETLKAMARTAFMSGGPWESIAQAVLKIKPILAAAEVTRKLAPTRAEATIRSWLSEFIVGDDRARAKLTEAAQRRLKKK